MISIANNSRRDATPGSSERRRKLVLYWRANGEIVDLRAEMKDRQGAFARLGCVKEAPGWDTMARVDTGLDARFFLQEAGRSAG